MAIVKKPVRQGGEPAQDLEKFIEAAPDGSRMKHVSNEEENVQITLRLSREQLERITAASKREGIPRASYIKRCIFVTLERDERIREIEVQQARAVSQA